MESLDGAPEQLAKAHPDVEQLCAYTAQTCADAPGIVINIRRVSKLRREEQLAELVSLAFLNTDEYEEHRDRTDLRSSYPLSELCEISAATARKLDRIGIRTSTDLLTHARTSADRSRLATKLNISRKRLASLVYQADLQRVPGIGDANVRAPPAGRAKAPSLRRSMRDWMRRYIPLSQGMVTEKVQQLVDVAQRSCRRRSTTQRPLSKPSMDSMASCKESPCSLHRQRSPSRPCGDASVSVLIAVGTIR